MFVCSDVTSTTTSFLTWQSDPEPIIRAMNSSNDIIQKLWMLSNVLRDDGMVYHQYMSELTYLLFLKLAAETGTEEMLPRGFRWSDLTVQNSDAQLSFYRKMLTHLGEDAVDPQIRQIFAFPTTVFKHAENLRIVVDRIDSLEWYAADRDDFGDIYEGLLEKNATESKSGAGQYFTPRALVDTIVHLVKPAPGEVVQDPAAGTGGFLVSSDRYVRHFNGPSARPVCQGAEIVKDTHRLCLMNMFVHGIAGKVVHGDALSNDHRQLDPADVIVTNPPFGARKGGGAPRRNDFMYPTVNKQLLFVQHILTGLKEGGRAAVVLPDNVLFEGNIAQRIRSEMMAVADLHTILRLPSGIFYSPGVKTNVLFFTRKKRSTLNTPHVWIYDARTNVPAFGKRNPLTREFFREFELLFGNHPHGDDRPVVNGLQSERWRRFSREEIADRGDNLDISWLRAESGIAVESSADLVELSTDLATTLRNALDEVDTLFALLAAAGGESGQLVE